MDRDAPANQGTLDGFGPRLGERDEHVFLLGRAQCLVVPVGHYRMAFEPDLVVGKAGELRDQKIEVGEVARGPVGRHILGVRGVGLEDDARHADPVSIGGNDALHAAGIAEPVLDRQRRGIADVLGYHRSRIGSGQGEERFTMQGTLPYLSFISWGCMKGARQGLGAIPPVRAGEDE